MGDLLAGLQGQCKVVCPSPSATISCCKCCCLAGQKISLRFLQHISAHCVAFTSTHKGLPSGVDSPVLRDVNTDFYFEVLCTCKFIWYLFCKNNRVVFT